MREGTRQTAQDVARGARALLKHERRPFHASGERSPRIHIRTNVLPSYASRASLEVAARRQAALAGGRKRFIIQSRLLTVGVPLGIVAGVLAWRGGRTSRVRSVSQFTLAFAATLGLTLLEATAEWRGMEEAEGA